MLLKVLGNNYWNGKKFYHVSTDTVYGSLGTSGLFSKKTPYDPNSPLTLHLKQVLIIL